MHDKPGVLHDERKDGFQAHPGHAGGRRARKQRRPFTEGKVDRHDRVVLHRGLAYLAAKPLHQVRQDIAYLARLGGPQQVPGRFVYSQHRVGIDAGQRVHREPSAAPRPEHARCHGRFSAPLTRCAAGRPAARFPWPAGLTEDLADGTADRPALVDEPAYGLYAADIRLPVPVRIDAGGVGGPSAGLAFALEVMEKLGRNVDRGYRVAATGQMELDGTVAPIGGVKQKTFGARAAGADVFLVPAAGDNAAEARRYAHGLRIIAVQSFPQALRALATLPLRR